MTALDARPTGLTEAEAARRLTDDGPNEVIGQRRTPMWARVVAQLRDPLILVLLAAAALTLATSDTTDAAIILTVVVVNTAVGVAQEVRADHAIAALSALAAPRTRVVRSGVEMRLPTRDVVRGDVVLLAEGDIVPADCMVDEANALLLDEAALTGESVPVDRTVSETISAGTTVVRGRAVAHITAIGRDSALGRIATLLDTAPASTPLQRRLAQLGGVLSVVVVVLSALIGVLGLLRGEPFERMALSAISLAVAAVPESLPAVVTLSLALGARRMARHHAIVRRLPAVETLGCVSVLATDKTGTLTEGRMSVSAIWLPVAAGGSDAAPRLIDLGDVPDRVPPQLRPLLAAAVLCNDATLPDEAQPHHGLGDPTEVALLAAAARFGVTRADAEATAPRIAEIPFDSLRMRMTTVHRTSDGITVCAKGALEALRREGMLSATPSDVLDSAAAAADELAARGHRVLAVAGTRRTDLPADLGDAERGLTLHGLVAIEDPPRASSAYTVARCRDAGMTPVLITGDHPDTARAIAERIGILGDHDSVVLGADLSDDSVDVRHVRVFARTAPEQKLDIVQAWQDTGAVVAMTGDGVNDAPALRRADIGVAMGRRGTEVARQAADLVLADDDLATVVTAVEEGRRIYANVRRYLLYALAGGLAEILVMLVGPFIGLALPLLAGQILWINLLTHGLTGVGLGAEPAEPDIMRRPPRDPSQPILGGGLWQRTAFVGTAIAAVSLGVSVWAHSGGRPWQSILFISLTSLQLGVALGSRARPGTTQNRFLLLAVAASLALILAGVYLPALRSLLATQYVPLADAALAVATGVVGWAIMRLPALAARR